MPRRRTNQNEMSATSGLNVAELPSMPIRTPCAIANAVRLCADATAKQPSASDTAPIVTGTATPKRSVSRPIRMPPRPKPISVAMYGSDAPPRATPKSACTAGSTTTTTYIPQPPIVDSARLTHSRNQAWRESVSGGIVGRSVA